MLCSVVKYLGSGIDHERSREKHSTLPLPVCFYNKEHSTVEASLFVYLTPMETSRYKSCQLASA